MSDFLKGETKVPVVGKTKKWVVYGVGGLAALYVGYRWYQTGRGPKTDDGMYTTPDQSEYGRSTSGGPLNIGGNNGAPVTDGTNPGSINTNAQWTQYAVEQLANAGYDPAVVYAALGEFLARRALDKSEASIARAALAAAGQPPEGRPWSVIEEATTGGNGTLGAPTGLAVKSVTDSSVTLSWSSVAGAGSYQIYQGGSASVKVSGTSGTVTGLKESTSYSFAVAAISTTGKTGAKSGAVSAKTSAKKSVPAIPGVPKPKPKPGSKIPPYTEVVAKSGDSISKIAARYGKSWRTVWDFNLKYRSPATVAVLKARGPDKIFAGTRVWVPR